MNITKISISILKHKIERNVIQQSAHVAVVAVGEEVADLVVDQEIFILEDLQAEVRIDEP